MSLRSDSMQLSSAERRWLPWFGKTGKLAMRWACHWNKAAGPTLEKTFEAIADTRVKLLQHWAQEQWQHLGELAALLARESGGLDATLLSEKLRQAPSFSELFVIGVDGALQASTFTGHTGNRAVNPAALKEGLKAPFLHGPYVDPLTVQIGPSTSRFHDQVTLMFYQPLKHDGKVLGCLCGRVPNDVLGDLIQREAGHIFPESGDNYLFMVRSQFDPSVAPGTALSRSRFEDDTFTGGDNLKSGVNTAFGTVRIQRHTELELRFTDPATGQLHPGIRETMRTGSNLFVTYPGYSDYRHIPVVGKGVTFQLPGSPDRWGMMCEADLEEVYRRRSLTHGLMKPYLATMAGLFACNFGVQHYSGLDQTFIDLIQAGSILLAAWLFSAIGPRRLAARLEAMTDVIRTIAEGEGNLRQRLDTSQLANDETGDMGRWINSFIDNLDAVVGQVIAASHSVGQTNEMMLGKSRMAGQTSNDVAQAIHRMMIIVEGQLGEIQQASLTAEQMKRAMDEVVLRAQEQFASVQAGTQSIRDVVQRSAASVQELDKRMNEIGTFTGLITDITNQTNLLALNAAIEAARAGENGRGFAVVADEVRTLASRTAQAAGQIRSMVEGLQTETRNAVAFMEGGVQNVDESLRLAESASSENVHLHEAVENLFGIIQQLNEKSLDCGQTIKQVDQASGDMRQTVVVLQHSAERVKHNASKLQQLVGQFEVTAGAA
ncbi:methyl-accepting chemotaxis protein [Pseudomonas sp. TE3610]